jgi:hypothetical protein
MMAAREIQETQKGMEEKVSLSPSDRRIWAVPRGIGRRSIRG